ncbi:hypothetical protein [Caulobacter sp. BP25]|uniref:hypothetical protein n=1 Tax=Caulobacter sp. BP25 TaxID=2048900 RepID=UPI00117DDF23|nr:hypothetical protein [Caulobacter sp. BP25]
MAGWLAALRRSFKKSSELRRISKQIGGPPPQSPLDLLRGRQAEQEGLSKLWDMVEGDPDLGRILLAHGADRGRLNKLINQLRAVGAGQWTSGHYVPVSTFAFGPTLDYVLRRTSGADLSRNDFLDVAYTLVDYFEKGRTGLVD